MIQITKERDVTGNYEEINIDFFMSLCPVCGDKRSLFLTIKSDDPLVIVVDKVCHAEYISSINKKLPNDLQLKI